MVAWISPIATTVQFYDGEGVERLRISSTFQKFALWTDTRNYGIDVSLRTKLQKLQIPADSDS